MLTPTTETADMNTTILIRSTAKNWIVSINRTNQHGVIANAPLATMPRRAYAAIALAALVTSAQKTFFADGVDRNLVHITRCIG